MNKHDFENEKLLADYKHKLAMEELKYSRETLEIRHRNEMEVHRITRADNQRRDEANFERQKELELFKIQNREKK